jgi:methyl-accepting chemotaxis protein
MKTFLNLKLSARLGAAFGFLVLALVVTTLVGLSGITKLNDGAEGGIAEVAAVAEEPSASAEHVSASTQQTSASTQEIASSAAELARTAEQLDELVRRFKITA